VARNIEIKARTSALQPLRARIERLVASPPQVLEQTDTFFTVPRGRLKLREFADGSGELIAYDRPDQPGPKQSVYFRWPCADARAASEALAAVLPVRGVIRKRREVFLIGRTRIHLDDVERLGCFVELEVVLGEGQSAEAGEQVARNLLAALEIPQTALVPGAYIDLAGPGVQE
jgi:adenylate cyclase class IV